MTEQRHAELGLHLANEGEDQSELLKRREIARRTRIAAIVVLVLLGLGAGRTLVSRYASAKALKTGTEERAVQYVQTALPKAGGSQLLALPGTLQGYVQAPIAARANGYLKRWTKDIGSRVEKGELLAEIETPEIDQQLTQAIAAREQAASSLALARSTVERWEGLRKKDVVSQQELDERRSAVTQGSANVAAADANVQRLRQLEAFKRVVAPFAGIITRRNVDVGDLIEGSRPLFLLSQTDPLRVYVNVPQSYASLVKPGQEVVVTQAELRGQAFKGEVARTSGSIDASTRTMQVEVSLPNRDGVLLPGAYVNVSLPLKGGQALLAPSNALLFRGEGTRVAVVDKAGRVALRPVSLGRYFGPTVEVLDGIGSGDRLVLNPSDSIASGDLVALAPAPASGDTAEAKR
ncbi:efflux RND transporter periplasmic adaptor subunit [Cupriavidus basilensis]|uniref:efflux RND transporter periplasmic adaptor subunit n=1 Tax=Cupriavidus basilensis TaxID=68895 RepID=UPI00157AA78A|nr:efflux RND transporter periplasmic adaptor subunit [Cupriavidus basilensis]NUA26979.1 efflux RND transporter periplasmic adaptor subunit [Cupriavidus basilensis]